MHDAKYKVFFHYKALNYSNIQQLSNIVSEKDSIKLYKIKCFRTIKENKVHHLDEKSFDSFETFLKYLDDDVKYLDNMLFIFIDSKKNEIWLKYDDIHERWELTYNEKTLEIDGFILNLKTLFKRNIVDVYKERKIMIFCIVLTNQLSICVLSKITGFISYFFDILLLITLLLNIILKCKPYREHKFIQKNKDEIVLSIIFYILGIITTFIIDFIKMIIQNK